MKIVRTSPLSSAQLGLWLKYQMAPHSMGLVVDFCCRLLGQLEPGRLQEAIQMVTDASDALRTFFGSENGVPVQHVRSSVQAPLECHRVACGEEAISVWAARPLDITGDVLFETLLIQESPGCWAWRTRFSHLVMDAVAAYAYIDAVSQAYGQLEQGCEVDLSYMRTYGEHLEAEVAYRASPRWQKDRAYWLARHPTPAEPVFGPGRGGDAGLKLRRAAIEADRYQALLKSCREDGLPVASVLACIVAVTALRQQGRTDFALAIASHNRTGIHRATLGMFSGYLPYRITLDSAEELAAMARRMDAQLRRDLRCRMFTADQLAAAGNSAAAAPVFDLVLSHVVHADVVGAMGTVSVRCEHAGGSDSGRVFILVHERSAGQAAEITLSYPPHVADEDEVQAFFDQFLRMAGQWSAFRRLRAAEVPLLDAPGRERAITGGNGPQHTVSALSDVLSRFDSLALARPDVVALICNRVTTTYGRLYERSLLLAAHLRALGVGPESVVGVRLERGEDLVVALLSILRAQGAYLPLDTAIPGERLKYMLDNSGARLLLTTSSLTDSTGAANIVCLDMLVLPGDKPAAAQLGITAADQLAYVIYTSGSAGQPKGVQISRGALANAMASFEHDLQAGPQEVFLSTTGISFDIFGLELFLPLSTGATLVLADRERLLETAYLPALAREHHATLFQATPSLVRNLLDTGWQPDGELRLLIGGETLTVDVAQRLAVAGDVFNVYGPTEATIWASVYRVQADCDRSPPIGRPIWNTQLYVLDGSLEPVPEGVTGELYIGGAQLARGYAARPDLTADRFVPNPYAAGERLYRTGDLARWRTDGELEYLGRADQQVKIRGHRIEPGEIERVLAAHPAVTAAAVVPRDDLPGGTQLVAYYIPDEAHENAIESELAGTQIAAWRNVYDSRYAQDAEHHKADEAVWTNSYTGQPYSAEDLREWAQATVSRIASLQPQRVLEVGCGSGLLMFPLAPQTQRYVGTDISGKALELLAGPAKTMSQIELWHLPAHSIGTLAPESYDLIILNSVVQYFPGANYLLDVLDQAYSLLAPGGHLFVGDVRNLALLPAFRACLKMHQQAAAPTCDELKREVQRQCEQESELCLDPAFFATLAGRYQLHSVQVLSRRGEAQTEMNAFRFDAVLRKTSAALTPAPAVERAVHWRSAQWSLAHLEAILEGADQEAFMLRGVPDARVQLGVALLNAARHGSADMVAEPTADNGHWIHPEAVVATALRLRWSATVRATRADGSFDVLLAPGVAAMMPPLLAEPVVNVPPQHYAGKPIASQMRRQVEGQLRQHMEGRLPDYMVPAFFVPLAELPLTTSGKLDRRALPKPELTTLADVSAPCDDNEARVATLMAQVLGLPHAPGRDASFFALGGHSLAAVRLVARLREAFGTEIGLKVVFESPTVAGLALRLKECDQTAFRPLVVHDYPAGSHVALSAAQEALWFLDRLQGPSAIYNMPCAFRLEGPLDIAALEKAFTALVVRHAVLRTVCAENAGAAFGVVRAAQPFKLQVFKTEQSIQTAVRQAAEVPFDLASDLMLRARLLQVDDVTHILILVVHHIAADGISLGVLGEELGALYGAACANAQASLAPLPAQYGDFAHWQQNCLRPEEIERQLEWWRAHLDGAPDVLGLPTDRPRPAVSQHRGGHLSISSGPRLRQQIEALATTNGVSSFSVLFAAYAALLSRLTRQDEVVVGVPASSRKFTQLAGLIGFFVNTLPLKVALGDAGTVIDLLRIADGTVKAGLANQDVSFHQLVKHLNIPRSLNHMPVFQTTFSYLEQETLALPGLRSTIVPVDVATARFDLALRLSPTAARGYEIAIEFDRDLFDSQTIERWAGHYLRVLEEFVQSPGSAIADLPLLTDADAHKILTEWNNNGDAPDVAFDVLAPFEQQVKIRPDKTAVICNGAKMSYAQLDDHANCLAQKLRQVGVQPEIVVGIRIERSHALMVAILAVMKAGAAYLPLDLDLPAARLDQMLGNSACSLVLTTPGSLNVKHGVHTLAVDVASQPSLAGRRESDWIDPDSLAYVIYTSGSTGQPKGVQVSRRSLSIFCAALQHVISIQSGDVVGSMTNASFDMFISEILPFLSAGATVVLADRGRLLDPGYVDGFVAAHAITAMIGTPSLYSSLLDMGCTLPPTLRIMTGGEALSNSLANRLCAMTSVWNRYGPTEATVAQAACALKPPFQNTPPIGRPFPKSMMYVMDGRLNPVPIGVIGELYIGGFQLARGYAARPDLTAERFIPNPFGTGDRLYRTGDLARWRPDGQLEHAGRADHQVKIRGYRIELREIEAALSSHCDVASVAVVAREDHPGDKRLVAYVVGREGRRAETLDLKAHLHDMLPSYMVPAAFVPMEKLPLTRNGKLDQRALPAPAWLASTGDLTVELDGLEQQIAQLMAQVLGLDAIADPRQSFFAMGGHSLSAVRLAARLRETFGVDCRLNSLFEAPTVAGLAGHIRAHDNAARQSPFVCFGQNSEAEPLFIVHGADGNAINFRKLGQLLAPHAKVYGVDTVHIWRSSEPTGGTSVEQLARLYADSILSEFPRLPQIRLGGWSFGGLVALEMARYLRGQGHEVAVAFAVDSALRWTASDGLAAVNSEGGLEQVVCRFLQEIGHIPKEIESVLADKSPGAFFSRLATAFRSHITAASRYRPNACGGEFTLILANRGTGLDARSVDCWRKALGEDLNERTIQGTHWSILGEPDVVGLAAEIAGLLVQAGEVVS